MGSLKVTVFFGSVREGRFGIRAAKYVAEMLKRQNHQVFLYDPEERPIPMMRKPVHHYTDPTQIPQYLQDLRKEIVSSDAFIVVSAEYNHSMPPALVNALDHFPPDDYRNKPCGIATYSYGNFGGVRAAMQLRCFLGELGMVTPPYIFAIPTIHESFSEDGKPQNNYMVKGAEKLIKEMEWYGYALKAHRENFGDLK